MTEQNPFSAETPGVPEQRPASPVAAEAPVTVDDAASAAAPAPAAKARSHSRIAALSIAAAVLLTAGAGAGAWGATALASSGPTTTAIGGAQSGSGAFGGSSGSTGTTDGSGAQGGFGAQGGAQGFGTRGGFGPGGSSGSGGGSSSSAAVDSTTATATQIRGVVTIVSQLGYESGESAGTGIVLTSTGRILTNNHVIDGATAIQVTDETTGKAYTAQVVGTNATEDIAVLQLQDANGLQTAAIASSAASSGDDVTAVGNAEGTGTLTAASGTVTDTGEQITTQSEGSAAGETLDGLIETDADVVSGDSGGPLKNADGQVVGITTAASSGSADITGYAIPITTALSVAEQILAGQDTDEITIGYPAFFGVSLSADASTTPGAVIAGALDGTPAAKAGLAAGDVITAVDGTAVGSAEALSDAIASHAPGDRVTIAYTDSTGASQTTSVVLIEGPAD